MLAGLLLGGCGRLIKSEYTVGTDVRQADVTEFYYTYENINYNACYLRYRFYVEDGKYYFYHEARERKDDYGYYVMGPIHNDRMDITFYFFDHDRRQIDQLDLTDGWRLMYVDDTRYWFGQFDPQGTLVSAYLDKSAIGSGNLKLTQPG